MRNAIKIDENTIVTIDNAGCIGEKAQDVVHVPNEVTAYYTARVAILEQWCAGAQPTHLFLSNFTSEDAWFDYEKGIERVFNEIGEKMPPLKGSTESNFESLQSGLSLMIIGKTTYETNVEHCDWFVVGKPLVGDEVVKEPNEVVKINELSSLLKLGVIRCVWPVGSKGIGHECEKIFKGRKVECLLPLDKSSGPSTSVIVAVQKSKIDQFKEVISTSCEEIRIIY